MTDQERLALAAQVSALSLFRGLLDQPEMKALLAFLSSNGAPHERMGLYGQFVHTLGRHNGSFSDYLRRAAAEDENAYICNIAKGRAVSDSLKANAEAELELFSRLTHLTPADLCESIAQGYLPIFDNEPTDFLSEYHQRIEQLDRYGFGIFAAAGMFRVEDKTIVPVEEPDKVGLESFVGYAEERRKVLENTRALIEGRPAANVLLCGDAGTGKSSTVKACANYFYDQGLRLIEIRKDQLFSLSHVMGRISGNPLKFIIFIDDLSFNKNDDCFSMLKAALEGSAGAKADNAVIYATSNRRHIVKEKFSDRGHEDDVHHSDTVQELLSLSDRFGLTVYFSKPNKALYLDIVHELAERYGVVMEPTQLDMQAEAFALARGSRSPRAAEQFVKSLM